MRLKNYSNENCKLILIEFSVCCVVEEADSAHSSATISFVVVLGLSTARLLCNFRRKAPSLKYLIGV